MTLPSSLTLAAYTDIEALAAATLAHGRACLPLLRAVVVPALPPLQRFTPERVIHQIETRNLVDDRTVTEIDILLDLVGRLVAQGTVQVTHWTDEFEGHVGEPRAFTDTRRTPEAERLAEAEAHHETLRDLAQSVLDLLHAQRAIQRRLDRG